MRHVFLEPKKLLDLLKKERPEPGFKPAVTNLFGQSPEHGKKIKIAGQELSYVDHDRKSASFLPVEWLIQLNELRTVWRGCENWRAGLPLIAFVEISKQNPDSSAELRINAEVGPVADIPLRKKIINTIENVASERNLVRIRFHPGASDKGRLYSRFLHGNSVLVSNLYDANETKEQIVDIIREFGGELNAISEAIPKFISGY